MTSKPLYALTAAYQQLLELSDAGEDITAELAALDEKIEAKAVNICMLLAQFDADEAAAQAESQRLAKRAKASANSAERLRSYIKSHMHAAQIRHIRSPQFVITLSRGQPKVVITDASKIPPELMRQPPQPPAEPDKVAIAKLHKQTGETIPGCDIQETHKLTVS